MVNFSVHCGPSEYVLQEGALLYLEEKLIEEESIHVMPIGEITANRVSKAITLLENRKN